MEVLKGMEANSVDAIVTDPPYGLSFMGKKWDYDVPEQAVWEECLRVLKPGGHLLAFAGTRTQHRMAVRIEDAGFEIRDMIAWVYGSGFPKSLDVSKAIDKAAGAERERVGVRSSFRPNAQAGRDPEGFQDRSDGAITLPASPESAAWAGWGTALKPALEPITMARKPLEGTVAANVLEHGTGGINVDGCRVNADGEIVEQSGKTVDIDRGKCAEGYDRPNATMFRTGKPAERGGPSNSQGRWPANLIHDGSEEVLAGFPQTAPSPKGPVRQGGQKSSGGIMNATGGERDGFGVGYGDTGSASRFFYCAKASKADRDEGCEGIDERPRHTMSGGECIAEGRTEAKGKASARNHHPTVKPTALMRYLCRLVTPPGGTVLDPFMGSGSTGKAAVLEGFKFIGIEREAEYVAIAEARIAEAQRQLGLFA